MIRIDNLSIGYKERILLADTSATFKCGQLTSLIGRNGSGKSTLLRAIAGLNFRYDGTIELAGSDIRKMSATEISRRLAFVSSRPARIPSMTCREIVAIGRSPYTDWFGRMRPEDEEAVDRALISVGMEGFAGRRVDTLSDGECQRVMIARALAQDTPAILLDEPTSYLDMPSRYELAELLGRLAHEQDKCILFSTHELDIATKMCDSVAMIDHGALLHLPSAEFSAGNYLTSWMSRFSR